MRTNKLMVEENEDQQTYGCSDGNSIQKRSRERPLNLRLVGGVLPVPAEVVDCDDHFLLEFEEHGANVLREIHPVTVVSAAVQQHLAASGPLQLLAYLSDLSFLEVRDDDALTQLERRLERLKEEAAGDRVRDDHRREADVREEKGGHLLAAVDRLLMAPAALLALSLASFLLLHRVFPTLLRFPVLDAVERDDDGGVGRRRRTVAVLREPLEGRRRRRRRALTHKDQRTVVDFARPAKFQNVGGIARSCLYSGKGLCRGFDQTSCENALIEGDEILAYELIYGTHVDRRTTNDRPHATIDTDFNGIRPRSMKTTKISPVGLRIILVCPNR